MVEKIAYSISGRSRRKKFDQFLHLVFPLPTERIVDVGVNVQEYSATDNYLEKFYIYPENITAVGLGDLTDFKARYPKVHAYEGDGRSLPYEDDAFDIAYSNAVIEHVGRGYTDQLQFLRELRRVSRRGYLTTPNRHFFIELHTRTPFLHLLLSKRKFDAVVTNLGKGWAAGDYMHLLSEKDVRDLLKNAGIHDYRLIKNRFLGIPMTFTVIWKKPTRFVARH